MERKGILVTGATGFAGSYILKYLIQTGWSDIHAIKRKSSPTGLVDETLDKVHWHDCDLLDQIGMQNIVEQVDYIIHSAAIISFVKSEVSKMLEVNFKGTAQLLNISLGLGIKKFVYISSVAAIGRQKNGQLLKEDCKWTNSRFTTNYAKSKHLAELECFRAEAEGLNMAILNPSMIMGAGLWASGSTSIIRKVYDGLSLYVKGSNGIVDVRDVAILAVKLLESDISGRRIIANSDNISLRKLSEHIAHKMGKKPPRYEVGYLLGEIAWRMDYIKSLLKKEKPIITKETMRQASAKFSYDNGLSKKLLNHNYIPWKDSIDQSIEAFLEHKKDGKYRTLDFSS